jgi:adenine phosphoribosyltransferase
LTLTQKSDYPVAIENYIEETPQHGWCDIAFILVRDAKTQKETSICSHPVFFEAFFQQQALSRSKQTSSEGYDVTIGEILHEQNPSIHTSDWHKEALYGSLSRKNLIEEALFKLLSQEERTFLKSHIRLYADFPKAGILFEDFTPILSDPQAFKTSIELLAKRYKRLNIEKIVGLESRGFITGAALAHELHIGFIPMRKAGKLPGEVFEVSYEKEYGADRFAISKQALLPGQRVLIIDDLIATGGSAKAAIDLVHLAQGQVIEFVSLLEIPSLKGRSRLKVPSFNLLD